MVVIECLNGKYFKKLSHDSCAYKYNVLKNRHNITAHLIAQSDHD